MVLRTGDIRLEDVFALAVRVLRNAFLGHTLGGLVDEDIQLAKPRDRALDKCLAVCFL
jgi:hypothetical protein